MAIHVWTENEHFKTLPPGKSIIAYGKRGWDSGTEYKETANALPGSERPVFIMPSFGRQGRWGNMVFQVLFMRVMARNNNRTIELFRSADWINDRINLYKDLQDVAGIQTRPNAFLIMDYEFQLGYIPSNLWRTIYVSTIRHLKCYFLKNINDAVTKPLPLAAEDTCVEMEGAFLFKSYNQENKDFILKQLFIPNDDFASFISDCLKKLGEDKTTIGIHIRRGDTVRNPLGQQFDLPVPVKYFLEWLELNVPNLKNPVIYVSSDDANVHKEFAAAGPEVFYKNKLLNGDERSSRYEKLEQVDWEILRNCDILLTSNSTFSFSAALLSNKTPVSYRFSVKNDMFQQFEPWDTDPLQIYSFSRFMWTTLFSRFRLVSRMVSLKMGCWRVAKDLIFWAFWKGSKVKYLYYIHGFSLKYIAKVFNVFDLVQVPKNNRIGSDDNNK